MDNIASNVLGTAGISIIILIIAVIASSAIESKFGQTEKTEWPFKLATFVSFFLILYSFGKGAIQNKEQSIKSFSSGKIIIVENQAVSKNNGWMLTGRNNYFIKGDKAVPTSNCYLYCLEGEL